jgi:hypothetical protein
MITGDRKPFSRKAVTESRQDLRLRTKLEPPFRFTGTEAPAFAVACLQHPQFGVENGDRCRAWTAERQFLDLAFGAPRGGALIRLPV